MKASLIFEWSLHILIMLSIEFNVEAVSNIYENSTITGKSLTYQLVKGQESKRIQTIVFYGCFSVWEGQYSKLEPPGSSRSSQFDESNNPSTCTEKCQSKNPDEPQMAFLRGKQCLCSPQSSFNSERTLPDYCNHKCPGSIMSSLSGTQDITNACGGNFQYSVYCLDNCKALSSKEKPKQTTPAKGDVAKKLQTSFATTSHALAYTCAQCFRQGSFSNLCNEQVNISPSFDYFPLNNAQNCVDFCKSEINYVKEWNTIDGFEMGTRFPTSYAILLWWRVPDIGNSIELPICSCYEGDIDEEFQEVFGHCDDTGYSCPGNPAQFCGGMANNFNFATVYCVEDSNEICRSGSSSQTTESSGTTVTEEMGCGSGSTTSEYSSTTEVTSTSLPTTSEVTKTTRKQGVTTEYPDFDPPAESSSESVGISESSTSTPYPTTSATDDTKDQTTVSLVTDAYTEATTEVSHVTNPAPPGIPQNNTCTNKCRKEDRLGNKWEGCAGRILRKQCSELISGSRGIAYWHCNNQSRFSTLQPNVTNCKSRWVQEMKEKLQEVNNMSQACEFTYSLHEGCKASQEHKSDTKYFGQEISQLAYLINDTLVKAKKFPDKSQDEFEKLVNSAVSLDACLINRHEPWIDLTIFERSYLSSELLEATEDVLFQLTQDVSTDTKYRKVFQPIQQFTAAAEAFDRRSASEEPYIFPPPDRGQHQESCIKLPVGWTDLLPNNKVEIAVISIAPESVAKIMTESGVYEVNGKSDRMLNGRLMSLTVTSSEKSIFTSINAVRSYPLKFSGEGVEIIFHHIVDAWGDKIYNIPRKLHEGEKRKAVIGGAQCVFWDTKLNIWSTEGCQLVKTNRLETVCECFHLTSFAILMDVHRYVGKETGLNIITLILCPISEIGLLLAIIILTLAKNCAYKIRTTICKHLCFCLFLGNGMILIFLDRNYIHMSEGVCMGAAMVAHYIFLCAFMWMFFEGVQLYRMVVNVFDNGKSYMRHFEIIAYGSPFIVIAVTSGIAYWKGDRPYGGDPYCWLVGNYIWTFMVPVALVITVNLIILFIALKTAYQLQHQGQTQRAPVFITDKIRSYRIYFRGCFSLTVILGLTWVLGFFVLMEGSGKIIAAYLFTILNASQGLFIFIFTFRVHMSKVRLFTQRKLSAYFPSLLNTGSTNNSMIIKKPNVVSRDGLGKDSIS